MKTNYRNNDAVIVIKKEKEKRITIVNSIHCLFKAKTSTWNSLETYQLGLCDIDPIVLSTSGISSCIAVVIELENKVFIYHADPIDPCQTSTVVNDRIRRNKTISV